MPGMQDWKKNFNRLINFYSDARYWMLDAGYFWL